MTTTTPRPVRPRPSTADSAVAETHSAVVFLYGDRAYKVKKPVDLGFLDFRTRAAREEVCHREVELNQRLAPDVYLGVSDVIGPDGQPCDHMVVMRRMPDDRRLATLVTQGAPVDDHLWHLAHLMAAFHSRAERSAAADSTASLDALAARWAASTETLAGFAGRFVDGDQVERIQALAERYLAGRGPLFARRIADGRACDGHGDLLAEDIFCLDDGPRVLDCIDFGAEYRYGDVLADVAFLAMDLERLDHPALAERFLAAYREHANDTWPSSLAHHHVAYRAHVRAKVAAIRADQGDRASIEEARNLLAMTERHLERARIRLVLVGGLPGTGKSTLSRGLGSCADAAVLRSDEIRKEQVRLPALAHAAAGYRQGIYTPTTTSATYAVMLERASMALGMGESVVLDASWTDPAWRARACHLADEHHADLVELRCTVSPEAAVARLRARAAEGLDVSDASPEIAAAMATDLAPWPSATSIDTSGPPVVSLSAALAVVQGTR
jgi:uncharacterized protein